MWPLIATGVATTFGTVGAYRRQERTQFARAKADVMVGIGKVFVLGNWALNQLSSAGGSSFAAHHIAGVPQAAAWAASAHTAVHACRPKSSR